MTETQNKVRQLRKSIIETTQALFSRVAVQRSRGNKLMIAILNMESVINQSSACFDTKNVGCFQAFGDDKINWDSDFLGRIRRFYCKRF